MKKALGIALILGMLFAGIVTIAHSRNERWDQIRQWNAVERYRRLWFNTTFALELDHLILFRAKDVYSRALYDTKEGNKDAKEIYKTFEYQLKKTIGDENFDKLSKTVRIRRGFRNRYWKLKGFV